MRLFPFALLLLSGCGAPPSPAPDACARLVSALELKGTEATLTAAALRAGDPGVWQAVREERAACPSEAAMEALLELARSSLEGIDLEALRTLGQWRCAGALPLLEAALEDPRPEARAEGLWGLRALGERGRLARIRELAEGAEPSVRSAAAAALGLLGDASDLPLLRRLRDDGDFSVSAEALLALAYRGERGLEDELEGLLAVPGMAEEAALALEALKRPEDVRQVPGG